MDGINAWTMECAARRLGEFKTRQPDCDVHTVTIMLNDLTPYLTIESTDQDLEDVVEKDIRL